MRLLLIMCILRNDKQLRAVLTYTVTDLFVVA